MPDLRPDLEEPKTSMAPTPPSSTRRRTTRPGRASIPGTCKGTASPCSSERSGSGSRSSAFARCRSTSSRSCSAASPGTQEQDARRGLPPRSAPDAPRRGPATPASSRATRRHRGPPHGSRVTRDGAMDMRPARRHCASTRVHPDRSLGPMPAGVPSQPGDRVVWPRPRGRRVLPLVAVRLGRDASRVGPQLAHTP